MQLLFLILMGIPSCKKFVEINPPVTKLTEPSVFANEATATGAQLGIYLQMFSGTYQVPLYFSLSADELQNYSSDNSIYPYYINLLLPNSDALIWNTGYNYIYQANAVIEGLNTSTAIAAPIKKQLSGEAYFTRAFWYFYLLNSYGDLPLCTITDYKVNALLARSSKDVVYSQIINDLKNAQGLLNGNYVDQSDTTATTDRIRPNVAVGTALLARAYLYAGKYDSAELEATSVIEDPKYSLEPNLNNVFLANSNETIWQLETPFPDLQTMQSQIGQGYILTAVPSSGGYQNCTTISPQLLNSFEAGDQRMADWVGVYTDNSVTPAVNYYYPFKYQVHDNNNNPSNRTEYTMMLRLAEQYLIRSEARAQQGNTQGALDDLNVIRQRAGLGDYSGATDQASLLAAILHERQVELFTEWGHRWFDLKRTGNVNSVMSVGAPSKGAIWNANGYQQLFPIPQIEIQNDHNLTQNFGY